MGKLRPKEGADQPGVLASHQLSKSNSLSQCDSDHPSSRGRGELLRETCVLAGAVGWGGGIKVLGGAGSGRMGDRAAGRGLGCVGEGAAHRVATANLSRPSSQVPEVWGWGLGGSGTRTSRQETEVGPPRRPRPHPPRDATLPRFGPALPARLPAAPRGLTCSRGGRSRGRR